MSVDHGVPHPHQFSERPEFLKVKPGDYVIVQGDQQIALKTSEEWWMAQVVFCEGGARDPKVNTIFQVSNVDDGGIFWINGDQVTHILSNA